MHRIANIMSLLRYKIYMHVRIMPQTVTFHCQSTSLMVSYLLLLPRCTAITGYQINSNNSNSQQQPMTGYRQTNESLPGMSRRAMYSEKTTNRIYA